MSFEYNDNSFSVLKRALGDDWYLTIFDNVKTVADGAFKDNHNIHELTFSNTERTVGKGAFENCSSLRIVHLGVVPEVPDYAFANCQALEGVFIVPTIRKIGDNAFLNCKNLRQIHLWNCISYISDTAFDGCDSLVCYVGKQSYAERYCREHNIRYRTTIVDDIEDDLLKEYTWLMGVDDVETYNIDENISFAEKFKRSLTESLVDNCTDIPEQVFDTVYEGEEIDNLVDDYEDDNDEDMSLLEDYENGRVETFNELEIENDNISEDSKVETFNELEIENDNISEDSVVEPYFCSDIDKNSENYTNATVDDIFVPVSEIEPYTELTMTNDYNENDGMEIITKSDGVENELATDDEDEPYCSSNLTIIEELGSETDMNIIKDKTAIIFNNVNGSEESIIDRPVKVTEDDVEMGAEMKVEGTPSSITIISDGGTEIANNCNLKSESTFVTEEGIDEMKKSKHRDKASIETYDQLVLVEDLNGNILTDVQIKPVESPNLNSYKNSDETGIYYITPDTKRSEYNGNRNIKELRVVEGVVEIPQWVAAYCPNLTTLVLAPSVKKIGAYAFYGSSNFKCVIDNSCDILNMEIGRDAFKGCRYRLGSTEK